jgi:hypothetical protein
MPFASEYLDSATAAMGDAPGMRVSYFLQPDWRDASKVMATDVEIVR